jgi:hypothetical protein
MRHHTDMIARMTAEARDAVSTWQKINDLKRYPITVDSVLNQKVVLFPMSDFHNQQCENFDSRRLQPTAEEAYPITNRPRGDADIASVKFHQGAVSTPIILVLDVSMHAIGRLILLDGAHRIVAHHINQREYIYAKVLVVSSQ